MQLDQKLSIGSIKALSPENTSHLPGSDARDHTHLKLHLAEPQKQFVSETEISNPAGAVLVGLGFT